VKEREEISSGSHNQAFRDFDTEGGMEEVTI
jgi:hypothetical protein